MTMSKYYEWTDVGHVEHVDNFSLFVRSSLHIIMNNCLNQSVKEASKKIMKKFHKAVMPPPRGFMKANISIWVTIVVIFNNKKHLMTKSVSD